MPKLCIVELEMTGNDWQYDRHRIDYISDITVRYIFEILRKAGKIEIELLEVVREDEDDM
jgi:hypothetical protein